MKKRIKYGIIFCIFCLLASHPLEAAEETITGIVYHTHVGNAAHGGGCYKQFTKTTGEWGYVDCGSSDGSCGHNEMGPNVCNRQIWKYIETTVTYYAPACGFDETLNLANVSCRKSTTDWTRELELEATVEMIHTGCKMQEKPFRWNDGEATDQSVFSISQNGTYTLETGMEYPVNAKAVLKTVVDNIDRIPPDIRKTDWNQEPYQERVKVTVDAEDSQCGLHETAYSFDGGENWQEGVEKELGNGVYEVVVRDRLENESRQEITIYQVDDQAPQVVSIGLTPSRWTNGNVTVTVQAEDNQTDMPEGYEQRGSGLHETAYSFDNGMHFQRENFIVTGDNGDIELAVRDRMDHVSFQKININNIDTTKPEAFLTQSPEKWTEGTLKLILSAKDEESGLDNCPFSFDGGKSWEYPAEYEVSEEGTYTALVRDKAGNVASAEITVNKEEEAIIPDWDIPISKIKYRPMEMPKQREEQKKVMDVAKEEETVVEEVLVELQSDRTESEEMKSLERAEAQETLKEDLFWKKWVLFFLILTGLPILILLFCFSVFYRMQIEGYQKNGNFLQKKTVHIRWKKTDMVCLVPRIFTEDKNCDYIVLIPTKVFLILHREKPITVITKEGSGVRTVQQQIKIRIKAF